MSTFFKNLLTDSGTSSKRFIMLIAITLFILEVIANYLLIFLGVHLPHEFIESTYEWTVIVLMSFGAVNGVQNIFTRRFQTQQAIGEAKAQAGTPDNIINQTVENQTVKAPGAVTQTTTE